MSVIIKIVEVTDLDSKADRYIKIVFRGVEHLTQLIKGCKGTVTFNEEFTWPLRTPIAEDEFADLSLYSKSMFGSDKLVAVYKCPLSSLSGEETFELSDNLRNTYDRIIKSEIKLELTYRLPLKSESEDIRIELPDDIAEGDANGVIVNNMLREVPMGVAFKGPRSHISSSSNGRTESKFGPIGGEDRTDVAAGMEMKEVFHPRTPTIHLPKVVSAKYCEWQVQVKIIEAKSLSGMGIEPFVEISVGNQKKHTTTKPHNNNPSWDEFFVFEFKLPKEQLLDQIVLFQVVTGRSLVSQGTLIGQFKLDLWTVYEQNDHSFFSKWAVLLGAEPNDIKGHLRVDISVLGKGAHVKPPPQKQELAICDENMLLPRGIQAHRSVAAYSVRIYAAQGLPRMITNLMANVKKAITGKIKDLADPYVEVSFAGCKGRTKTIKSSYEPEFNQEIIFWEFLPPMCRRFKIQLRDGDEAIGTHFLDLKEISDMQGGTQRDGFMPCFGPCWVHLYGSTRDYSYFNENNELNEGIGEGISYRGRVLLEVETTEYEPCETGIVEVKDFLPPRASKKRKLPKERQFQLFSCFYEASMIDKRSGERPVQFEISIGEHGYHTEDNTSKDSKSLRGSKSEEELHLLQSDCDENSDGFTVTKALKPADHSKRYCIMRWEDCKPCLNLKFALGDERTRHFYQSIILKHYSRLEDNLDELDERIKLNLSGTKSVLKRVLQDLVHGCNALIKITNEKSSENDLRNILDEYRFEIRTTEVDRISKEAAEMLRNLTSDKECIRKICDDLREKHLNAIKKLLYEPHHGFPDIFIWMLSGGKRVAYARIPAVDVLFSGNDYERGLHCGKLQTVFLKPVVKKGNHETDWLIHAKLNMIVWLGLHSERHHVLKYAPKGFSKESEVPRSIKYNQSNHFILRAHIYQARSLFGSDDTGLSDALARVIYCDKVKETQVMWETRSPTWDQMLKFKKLTIWGDVDEFRCSPPLVVIEIYDKDKNSEMEFIGRSMATPVVKLLNQTYSKPFFPPVLQWFPIRRGEDKAGDLLAAFELFQTCDDDLSLPYDPDPLPNGVVGIPQEIKPKTMTYIVEVYFWGVREMKRVKYLHVIRPRVNLDCCYKVRAFDTKTRKKCQNKQQSISSSICKNARFNPNFEDPVVVFEVDLPDERYTPPVTIRVSDCRPFGRNVLAGSYVINSLQKYIQKTEDYERMIKTENHGFSRCFSTSASIPNGVTTDRKLPLPNATKENILKKTQKKKEEIIDWWTRLHVSECVTDSGTDTEDSGEAGNNNSNNNNNNNDAQVVPKIMIYPCELEKVKHFGEFSDAVETFPLTMGKQIGDDDDNFDLRRFSGKFKGCIRIWKAESLPDKYNDIESFKPTFREHKLLKYDPVKVLVRVYVIKGSNLKPADPNGKADPYLVVTLGKHKVNDKKNAVTRQLNPEFGRMFEFEAELPFDNLLTVQVFDWDLASFDDFIGETKIDIENRYYSKHRATCGLPLVYDPHGCCKWRDSMKPSQILLDLCKREGRPHPEFIENECRIGTKRFIPNSKSFKDEKGNSTPSKEHAALKALRDFATLEDGYHLVPEHIESRTLYRPDKPGISQGTVEMWVDMFSMEGPSPGPPVDIAPRKPEEFELRVIVWNTDHIPPADTNVLTGIPSSDIYVKGWLEGQIDDIQKTDVHYRSTDGNGMFNWRFVFPFLFHRAKQKFVTKKKASIIGFDEWEETHDPMLRLEVLDADVFSSDDLIGNLEINITKVPPPMKASKLCKLDMLDTKENLSSLIQNCAMRGWWAIRGYNEEGNIVQKGEVELEFELEKGRS